MSSSIRRKKSRIRHVECSVFKTRMMDAIVEESPQEINNPNNHSASNGLNNSKKKSKMKISGLFTNPFLKTKKKKQADKRLVVASCVDELPKDLQKKVLDNISKSEADNNFELICKVLHFVTKDNFEIPGIGKMKPSERTSYATVEAIEDAKSEIKQNINVKHLFKNIRSAGKGGFGRVYVGRSIEDDKEYALKKLPHVRSKHIETNYSEISFLMRCQHENIMGYHSSYVYEKYMWIVSEYLEGGTLSDAIKLHRFDEPQISYIVREVLKGLSFLHSIDFVHRDVKPSNIMISMDGRVKLIDFGLCADVSNGKRNQMVGSAYWMSPEMVMRQPHDTKSDMWSLGICAVELMTGYPPYFGNRFKCMYNTALGNVKKPKQSSKVFSNFLSKLLVANPENRASANELLNHGFMELGESVDISKLVQSIYLAVNISMTGI